MARATTKSQTGKSMFTADLLVPAIGDAFRKLDPRDLIRNPVMFVTACVALLMTILLVIGSDALGFGFKLQLVLWLWLTVLFGTFAEALAEARQGAGRIAARRQGRADRPAPQERADRGCPGQPASRRRHRAGDDRRPDPGRWRGDRGCCLRQ